MTILKGILAGLFFTSVLMMWCSSGEVNEMERKRDWRLVLMRVSGYIMEWQMTPAIGWQGGEMYG